MLFVSIGCEEGEDEWSPSASSVFEGHIGVASEQVISGWAWDKSQVDTAISVEIYDGDVLLGSITANRLREDLRKAGYGNGNHGFVFRTPASLKDGENHTIIVRVKGTDVKLNPKAGLPLKHGDKES
jgi:hypothetical protein